MNRGVLEGAFYPFFFSPRRGGRGGSARKLGPWGKRTREHPAHLDVPSAASASL